MWGRTRNRNNTGQLDRDAQAGSPPPRFAFAVLNSVLPIEVRDDVLGDLQEGFLSRRVESGESTARRWYRRQALQSLRYIGGTKAPDPRRGAENGKLRKALMGFFKYDVRYAIRQLRANPGFTAVAVLSLALGIGVNSTIFTIVNGFLLKPLPVADIEELVEVFTSGTSDSFNLSSNLDYIDYRQEVDAFEGLAANMTMLFNWNRETHSETLFGELVSDNYFAVLGIEPQLGRFFATDENLTPGTHPVAVLSHGFWQRAFAGNSSIVGETIRLNGTHFTVVGVAPAEFTGTIPVLRPDLWTPLMTEPLINVFSEGRSIMEERGSRSLRIYGRLAEGATEELARAQLETVAARLAAEYPETNEDRSVSTKPLRDIRLHPELDSVLAPVAALLMGLVTLVLLVACANVANMLLARGAARSREIGVRLAMGASRWRIVRQLLAESTLLSLAGGTAALLLTFWVTSILMRYQPPLMMALTFDLSPDLRVLGFTLATALLTGLVFGLVPALRCSRPDLIATLKDDAAGGGTRRRFGLRGSLVVAQVAVSLVLLVTASLFGRSLGNAHAVELGFDEENIAFVSASLSAAGYGREEGRRFLRDMSERIAGLPGVVDATYTARLPMNLTNVTESIIIEGYVPEEDDLSVVVEHNTIGPRYFEILRIPLLAGREILETDDARSTPVAVVNEEFVARYWPGENAVGKRFRFDGDADPWIEVVGIAANYKMSSVGEQAQPLMHTSLMQQMAFIETIMVRTESAPGPMVERMRAEITARDPDIAFFDARTMAENLAVVLFPVRVGAAMLAVFGLLALGLAAVGVYGVIAYSVSRRTHEIGIRMALGAGSGEVLRLVVRQGMTVVLVGVAIGLAGALALANSLGAYLYDVSTVDPIAFLGTVAVLVCVALLANYIPARRGARVDPIIALRSE